MILFPNAKINLGLFVTGRRSNGYHDIETVMYPVGWTDILEITPAPVGVAESSLTVTGHGVNCPPEKNLVIKALRAFERYTRHNIHVEIRLHKLIPDGAGLGGGSSDAAFTIIALNRLSETGLTNTEMERIASEIGADCPFFIRNRPMLATGTGTTLSQAEVSLRGLLLAIVKPQESVSTAQAYSGVTPAVPVRHVWETLARPICEWNGELTNDFEKSVFPQCGIIRQVKEKMMSMNPLYCSMSGSGSAVYALFEPDRMSAEDMRHTLSGIFPGMEIYTEHIRH